MTDRFDTTKRAAFADHYERKAKKDAKKQSKKPDNSSDPKPPKKGRKSKVMGINVEEYVKLIKKRSGKDKLARMTDELQARLAFSNISIIEEVEKSVMDSDGVVRVEDHTKLINAMKGAMGTVNDALKALGVSNATREVKDEDDAALKKVMEESIQGNSPPELEEEHLRVKADIERTSGKGVHELADSGDSFQSGVLSEIKQPLSAFVEDEKKKDSSVEINVDEVGVRKLG